MIDVERLRSRLNPAQLEAVTHGEGPVLILAGAGSGKTRVITHRIAYLIGSLGARPDDVVAVTFTNKAAGEMRERVEQLVGRDIVGAFVGTFHAFGLRILRRHAVSAGYAPSFVVYDQADQLAAVRESLRSLSIDDKQLPPRQVLAWISRAKNDLLSPADAEERARFPADRLRAECYREYEQRLARASALDFDDLLVQVIRLFRRHPELAREYASRIRWLLVDEFQDTNPIQYQLIKSLTTQHRNVCCVGDEDQSIYSFRGADIRNILDFERDYPDTRVIKLEQNYRSTGTVLAAASALISNNLDRHEKRLWTENERGPRIVLHVAQDDREEADFVVHELLRRSKETGIPLDEWSILYRTNATSRLFEDRLTSRDIPYRVVGGLRFYERKEIKDVVAWLRLLVHPDSDQDFLRAAGVPPRGIGAKTLAALQRESAERGTSLHDAARAIASDESRTAPRTRRVVSALLSAIEDLRRLCAGMSTAGAVTSVVEAIEYPAYLAQAYPADHTARAENLEALVSAAQEHDDGGAPDGMLGFLDRISLRSDADSTQGERGPTLMTVHSAKGLEFDAVFMVAMNEDLFPHSMSLQERDGIEEERRLAYVALTRARKQIVLSASRFRYRYGDPVLSEPSRFLSEIPSELLAPTSGTAENTVRTARARVHVNGRGPARSAAAGLSHRSGSLRYETDDEPAADAMPFEPGMRIIHPAFGPGRVLATSGTGRRVTLDIRFERAGRKRILPAFTTLMPG